MVWPATGRWARRLVELLVAIILAKFLIVAILTLATAAIANTSVAQGDGNTFEQMLAGSALLVLAAWSPFALLRTIPMMKSPRRTSPANARRCRQPLDLPVFEMTGYMRQAMDQNSRPSSAPANPTTGGTTCATCPRTRRSAAGTTGEWPQTGPGGARCGRPSLFHSRTVEPSIHQASAPPPRTHAQPPASSDSRHPQRAARLRLLRQLTGPGHQNRHPRSPRCPRPVEPMPPPPRTERPRPSNAADSRRLRDGGDA